MSNDVARDIHCDVTVSNDIAMCTYHGIKMDYDFAMKLFHLLLCITVPNCVMLLWVVRNKMKNNFMVDQYGLENTIIVFV